MKKILKGMVAAMLLLSIVACSSGKEVELKLGQVIGAPHGTKSFGVTTVVVEGDKVVLAYIDEFQYLADDKFTGVPNSDAFAEAEAVKAGFVLGSKRVNDKAYSDNMAKAGSTVTIAKNYDLIQEFVVGKTIAEIEEVAKKPAEEAIDAVTGATLVDMPGYLMEIVNAAKAADQKVMYKGDVSKLTLKQVLGAPHGTKSFGLTTVVTDGEKVVLAHIDEFQYLADDKFTGVANSDAFAEAESVKAGLVLGSKRVNDKAYSDNMAKAGSTVAIAKNYDIIQEFVAGKTVAEIEEVAKKPAEEAIDAVTGATLVDMPGYLMEIVNAAK